MNIKTVLIIVLILAGATEPSRLNGMQPAQPYYNSFDLDYESQEPIPNPAPRRKKLLIGALVAGIVLMTPLLYTTQAHNYTYLHDNHKPIELHQEQHRQQIPPQLRKLLPSGITSWTEMYSSPDPYNCINRCALMETSTNQTQSDKPNLYNCCLRCPTIDSEPSYHCCLGCPIAKYYHLTKEQEEARLEAMRQSYAWAVSKTCKSSLSSCLDKDGH